MRRIVVVGGSAAGAHAAQSLRKRGYSGELVMIGAEQARPYRRPELSKGYLTGAVSADSLSLNADDADIEMLLGTRAVALDVGARRLRVVDERGRREWDCPFDGLVIATGARPTSLGWPPREGVHLLRTIADADRLRADLAQALRVVVIGGGLVGCEVAATCRELGLEVSIVEAAPTLMGRALGPEVGAFLGRLHRQHGVAVELEAQVTGLLGGTRVDAVALSDGRVLPADIVVLGIGATPETAWLEGSGVPLADGVRCHPDLSVVGTERIVAAGDVVRWRHPLFDEDIRVEHWLNAVRQGEAAAHALLDERNVPLYDEVSLFWSHQYDARIQLFGHVQRSDRLQVLEGHLDEGRCVAVYGHSGRVSALLLLNAPQRLATYRRLVTDRVPFPVELAGLDLSTHDKVTMEVPL